MSLVMPQPAIISVSTVVVCTRCGETGLCGDGLFPVSFLFSYKPSQEATVMKTKV